MDARAQEKRQQLERALERGVVMIHLDARRPGVVVPARLREDHHLRLNVSLRFDPPDLSVGEWGVRETLSFGGERFSVAVPWSAIFAITGAGRNEQAWLYPEDMPKELFDAAARHFGLTGQEVDRLREEAEALDRPEPSPAREGGPPRRAALQVVSNADDEPSAAAAEGQPVPAPEEKPAEVPVPAIKGSRGHLKLVK